MKDRVHLLCFGNNEQHQIENDQGSDISKRIAICWPEVVG
jgi:hypothetical protein